MKRYAYLWPICVLCATLSITVCSVNHTKPKFVVASENHPRLFFDANEIPALQAEAATTHQQIWIPIRDYVESELGTSPPPSAPPDGDLETYANYGNRLLPFAFACIITGQADYCDLAKTYLLTYAAWGQWGENNWRDLGHAHMLLGNAIAYDWLYDSLTPAERQTVRQSLADWAQKMYEASSEPYQSSWENWWWKSYLQNHHWINNSALGMAGLALLGEDERAQTWIDQASSRLSRVQYILNGIQDGSWHEGISYQSYGLTLSLPFMVNLRRVQEAEILPHAYLRHYPYWRIYNHIPDSTQFVLAYGDFEWWWGNSNQPQNLLRFIASEYGDGHAEWMAQQLIAAEGRHAHIWSAPWYVFEFLYYDPTIIPQSPVDLEKASAFPDLDGVIWRTGWGEDDLIFGLKTGTYGGRFAFDTFTQGVYPWEPPCSDTGCELNISHDHNDTNGFYIHRAGQWLAPEREGWGYDRRATALHNTLLIDGQGQYRPPDDHYGQYPEDFIGSDGFLEATASTPGFDYVAADATRRYKDITGLEDITRHVLFIRPDYFVMLDNLAADAAHQYDWVCHFGESVSVEGDWVRGNAGDGQILGISVAAPQPFEVTTGNDGRPYVHVRPASPVDDVRLIHILYPTDNVSWNTKPGVAVLEDTGVAAAVSVQMNDGRTDDVLLTYAQPVSATAVGHYYYDGQVAVISRGADDGLEKLFVYGGTFLTDQTTDKVLVTNLDRNEPFDAAYSDQTVAVYGNVLTQVTLYAPQAEHLTLNGIPWFFTRSDDYITIGEGDLIYLPLILN